MKTTTTAERLKDIMKERDISQTDILKLCEPYCKKYGIKITKSHISLYVSGKVEPGENKLRILAKALNVSEVWLLGYEEPKETGINKDDYTYYKEMAEDRQYLLQEIIKVLGMEEDALYEDVLSEVERLKEIKDKLQVLYNIAIQNEK